jgi:hypothetical protein
MKGCRISLGIVVGLVLLGMSSCWLAYGPTHIRYRLTIDVKDGDSVRSGSSVVEVAYNVTLPIFRAFGGLEWAASVSGNAVTVDLGTKGLLFAIFRVGNYGNMSIYLPIAAYRLKNPDNSPEQVEADLTQLKRKSGWAAVPKDALPTLIRFGNIDDPNSAEQLDPSNLAASFGAGVELKSVRLELTNDPITPVPAVWPAWLKKLDTNQYAAGGSSCWIKTTPLCLQGVDFKGG